MADADQTELTSLQLAELAADACDDRKATGIELIRVDEVSSLADWMVIAGGHTDVQVRAIARSVQDKVEEVTGRLPIRREGLNEARWALLDYGELIVHILQPGERSYYDLEAFWGHGERRTFVASEPDQGL